MKKSGKCPKCDGIEVYTNEGLMKQGERSGLHLGGFSRFLITSYICTNCGYLEEFIEKDDLKNEKKMNKIRSKWKLHH